MLFYELLFLLAHYYIKYNVAKYYSCMCVCERFNNLISVENAAHLLCRTLYSKASGLEYQRRRTIERKIGNNRIREREKGGGGEQTKIKDGMEFQTKRENYFSHHSEPISSFFFYPR